jgi:hypothetical protein
MTRWAVVAAGLALLAAAPAAAGRLEPPSLNGPIVYTHWFNQGDRVFRAGIDAPDAREWPDPRH